MSIRAKAKKRTKRVVTRGVVHISATFNNTIISIADVHGNVLVQSSAGRHLKGSKKSTPHGAQLVAEYVANKVVQNHGMTTVDIYLTGPGAGRESAVRTICANVDNVLTIKDVTPIPHNGCRAKKRRRV